MEVILTKMSFVRFDIYDTEECDYGMREIYTKEMDLNLEQQFNSEKIW